METKKDSLKRAANFTKDEENILIALIEKYKHIIECKKSNVQTWKDKEKIWRLLETEFNSKSGETFRNAKHLKEKYTNMKKSTKRKFAEEKKETFKTGGGTFTPILVTDVDIAIKNILGTQIEGLESSYDCDVSEKRLNCPQQDLEAAVTAQIEDHVMEELCCSRQTEDIELSIIECGNDKENEHDWSTYTPKNLKKPKSKKLSVNKTLSFGHKTPRSNILVEEKIEFVRLQKEKFLIEHEMRMKIMKIELSNVEMENQIKKITITNLE